MNAPPYVFHAASDCRRRTKNVIKYSKSLEFNDHI